MENRNLEGMRQDLAGRLVQREVVCCVSSLVSGLTELSQLVGYSELRDALGTDSDELSALCQRPNYEEAVRQFIMNDADLDQLEEVAEQHGYWSDALADAGLTPNTAGADDHLEGYLESEPDKFNLLRQCVWELINTDDEYQWVCREYDLDYDYDEVYEHWVVSDWLQRKLAEKGEITGDLCGLTIWGRCCTGQSMVLDSVIQEITRELWPEEWAGEKA